MARIVGTPVCVASTAVANRYGISRHLSLVKKAQHIDRFLVEQPRHAITVAAVQPTMAEEQPERAPAHVTWASAVPSKPPMSWLQKPNPLRP